MAQQWYDLGNAWLDKGDWKKAGEAYSRALALNPSFAGASFNLARALVEAGDYDGALKILAVLAKRDPGNVRIIAARAYALYKKGDAAKALAAYREALKLDPYAPDAVYNAALLELASGDAASAPSPTSSDLTDGQERRRPGLPPPRPGAGQAGPDRRGRAARGPAPPSSRAFDRVQALAAYEKAKTLGKADADGLERMARALRRRDRYSEQMDALEARVKADPKRGADWFALARLRLVVAERRRQGLGRAQERPRRGLRRQGRGGRPPRRARPPRARQGPRPAQGQEPRRNE